MEQQTPNIVQKIDHVDAGRDARVKENQKKLGSILSLLDTVILCGHQNIPLRGHREENCSEDDHQGNVRALLQFRVESGDSLLLNHLQNGPRNAQYTSKTIQNELISLPSAQIRTAIITKVRDAKFFSIMADEVTDSANMAKLSLCVWFIDGCSIQELFLGFMRCHSVTGSAIAEIIVKELQEFGLDLSYLHGQCYDGAGNMSGATKGAAAIIREQYPEATYVHCSSHVLNLAIVKACDLPPIRNFMGTMTELCIFFKYSPKRQGLLERNIQDAVPEESISRKKTAGFVQNSMGCSA